MPDDLAANAVDVDAPDADLGRLQRSFYTSSSCGVCGKGALEAVAVEAPRVESDLRVEAALVVQLPDRLREAQAAFEATGGLHATGLFAADGELLCIREDVGRHNALDKVVGRAFLDGRLLDELEGEAAADAENRARERQQPVEKGAADHLVQRVVAADVLADAQQLALGGEEPGRVQPARCLEGRLCLAEPVGKLDDQRRLDPQVALHPRRLDRDGLERALAADTARGRGVEAALQPAEVCIGRVDVDRVDGEIVGHAGGERVQSLREAEAERELLVVPRRPHRHRHGRAADSDLERLLDRDDVSGLPARNPRHLHASRALRRRFHQQNSTAQVFSTTGISIVRK